MGRRRQVLSAACYGVPLGFATIRPLNPMLNPPDATRYWHDPRPQREQPEAKQLIQLASIHNMIGPPDRVNPLVVVIAGEEGTGRTTLANLILQEYMSRLGVTLVGVTAAARINGGRCEGESAQASLQHWIQGLLLEANGEQRGLPAEVDGLGRALENISDIRPLERATGEFCLAVRRAYAERLGRLCLGMRLLEVPNFCVIRAAINVLTACTSVPVHAPNGSVSPPPIAVFTVGCSEDAKRRVLDNLVDLVARPTEAIQIEFLETSGWPDQIAAHFLAHYWRMNVQPPTAPAPFGPSDLAQQLSRHWPNGRTFAELLDLAFYLLCQRADNMCGREPLHTLPAAACWPANTGLVMDPLFLERAIETFRHLGPFRGFRG